MKAFFILSLALAASCYVTIKFKPVAFKPDPLDADAIFRSDFPFQLSPQTPDLSTVIPPARPGCSVKLLPAGDANFSFKYYLLENARQSIRLQTYILYKDPVGEKTVKIVKEQNTKGVEIKLIADCYTKILPKDRLFYSRIRRSGLDLLGFEPLYFTVNGSPNRVIDGDEVNMRFHEKYWIVDDDVAITGGTNIAAEYADYEDIPRLMWRDQDVVLTGTVVKDISRAFDENYAYFWNKRANRIDLFNPEFFRQQRQKNKKPGEGAEKPGPSGEAARPPAIKVSGFTDENVLVRFVRHRPRLKETYIHQAYIHLFTTAKKRILIENSYILLDDSQFQALAEAAQRGVEVTIVTSSKRTNDVSMMTPLTRRSYLALMQAGIKIYEWQGIVPGRGALHSKYAVFDDDISVVGSFNLDPRSTFLNSEDIVIIKSRKVAEELARYTEEIDIKQSRLITMEQAKKWSGNNSFSALWIHIAGLFKYWW